jgi:hypothetical protein
MKEVGVAVSLFLIVMVEWLARQACRRAVFARNINENDSHYDSY